MTAIISPIHPYSAPRRHPLEMRHTYRQIPRPPLQRQPPAAAQPGPRAPPRILDKRTPAHHRSQHPIQNRQQAINRPPPAALHGELHRPVLTAPLPRGGWHGDTFHGVDGQHERGCAEDLEQRRRREEEEDGVDRGEDEEEREERGVELVCGGVGGAEGGEEGFLFCFALGVSGGRMDGWMDGIGKGRERYLLRPCVGGGRRLRRGTGRRSGGGSGPWFLVKLGERGAIACEEGRRRRDEMRWAYMLWYKQGISGSSARENVQTWGTGVERLSVGIT